MDSLAIVSLVVCGAVGAATLVVGWRWLRRVSSPPSPEASSAMTSAPEAATPPRPVTRPLPLLDDEPTEPMMRTSWGSTGWPSTQPVSDFGASGYAPTQPMPLKPEER